MKRLCIAGFATLLALGQAPPAQGAVAAATERKAVLRVERASARWVVENPKGEIVMYRVEAYRAWDVQTGTSEELAEVDRLECEREDDDGLSCGGGPGEFQTVAGIPEIFQVSDDLSSGVVKLRVRDQTHFVRWSKADPAPLPYEQSEACPYGDGFGRGLHRGTAATARLFGRRFGPEQHHDLDRSWLERGVHLTDCRRP